MNNTNNQNEINIGVDTGKHQLDIYIRPLDVFFSVPNDEQGIKTAITKLKPYQPTRIIIEATGRLKHDFILACSEAKLPFVVSNPLSRRRQLITMQTMEKNRLKIMPKKSLQLIVHINLTE